MATPSDKAKRAAATKAFNQRQQELDDQALIESTRREYCSFSLYDNNLLSFYIDEEPRQAKSKALEAAGREPSVTGITWLSNSN